METENRKLLIEGAHAFGVYLEEEAVRAFDLLLKELLKWNRKINLTAIRTEREIITKHFLDSLSIHPYLEKSVSLLDVGSGPGFPGIPLKIAKPALDITLIDAVRKKVDFQRHVIRSLGLKGMEAIQGRIEDPETIRRMEGRFDRVVSRAFSSLPTFLHLAYPFLKRRGIALVMKGGLRGEETQTGIEGERDRFTLQRAVVFPLPFTSMKRTLLLFEKQ